MKFIKPGFFKYVLCIDKDINKAYLQRVCQGRSTSLSILGLAHSASNPVFPMNVSNMDDLMGEDEDIDYSMYDNPDINNNIWDNDLLREEDDIMENAYENRLREVYNDQIQDDDFSDNEPLSRGYHRSEQITDDDIAQDSGSDAGPEEEEDAERHSQYEDSDPERLTTDNDDFAESAEEQDNSTARNDMNSTVWGRQNRFPTRADWTLSIIDDHTHDNRDGWGDEIVAEMRNNAIDEPEDTTLNRLIRERTSSETTHENIPTFAPSNSNSSNWSDKSDDTYETAEEEVAETVHRPSYCIPNAIKRSTSSTDRLEKQNKANKKLNPSLGEYLMISTGKDVIMMGTTTPKMSRIRAEHNVINKVDVRLDQMLSILDRINMVEWLPELELFVAASQKGTVALMRVLQVEFEGGEQGCIFNNECYLPTDVFQATPLYGNYLFLTAL